MPSRRVRPEWFDRSRGWGAVDPDPGNPWRISWVTTDEPEDTEDEKPQRKKKRKIRPDR